MLFFRISQNSLRGKNLKMKDVSGAVLENLKQDDNWISLEIFNDQFS